MKASTIVRFALALLLCLLGPATAPAAEKAMSLEHADLEDLFREVVQENSPWPAGDLVVDNFQARPAQLTVPQGKLGYRLIREPQYTHLGNKVLTLAVLVDGSEYGQVKMSGDLKLMGEVVCLNKRLNRNAVIEAGDVTVLRHDISMLDSNLIRKPEQAIGQLLKTSLRPGAILYAHLLEPPPLVKRGDLVTIMAQTDNIRVTVPGEVRDTGALGETVKVKNLMSRREIFARVLGSGVVETEF